MRQVWRHRRRRRRRVLGLADQVFGGQFAATTTPTIVRQQHDGAHRVVDVDQHHLGHLGQVSRGPRDAAAAIGSRLPRYSYAGAPAATAVQGRPRVCAHPKSPVRATCACARTDAVPAKCDMHYL